ncbi:OmpP1/FadL family transporter [Sutterella sp.]|uniref:OmpP1/FadL family transporter n=1 Tax=Sutterella sp. TaxID=1981025 RepID=UPI0026E0821E|nr:outer membrane protein transport protein [Sutterella sp.]MDO5532250.1 outer membrane protein transport protein [Sutterella sp.]
MIRTNLKIAATALAVASTFASTAYAAGFQLTEQSALALGRAYAGVGVDGTDISGIYYNPATMTLHKGTQVQLGLVGVGLNLEYVDKQNGTKENGRAGEEVLPHGYISHQINDSTWVGLAITIPYGLSTNYDENWSRQDQGTDAKITVINFNPNFAWKVTDKVSIGAGIALQYVDAEFGVGVDLSNYGAAGTIHNKYKADDFTWGFNVGLMWAPVENLRFGISYRSETKHKTNGTLTTSGSAADVLGLSGSRDASVTVAGPAWAMFNAAWDVNQYLSLYATFRWADWSSFSELKTESTEMDTAVGSVVQATGNRTVASVFSAMANIDNSWTDTYLYSLGYDLRVNEFWTLRGGIAYETSAIGDRQKRTAIIPDADRWWFAIGSSFHWTKDFQTDIGFAHLHGVHERSLYDHQTGAEIGKYRHLDAYLLGVQMQYRF